MPDVEPASFRDPDATVFTQDGRIFRGLSALAKESYDEAERVGLLGALVDRGLLIDHWRAEPPRDLPAGVPAELVIEARRVPVVTYPYEWSFSMLRDAALLTLEVTEASLQAGFQLKDASAYNVAFDGTRPVFIDLTSVDQGFDGLWTAYGQFCDHFLAPLLLESHLGIPFQPYLRGRLSGLPVTELAPMLGGLRRLRRGVFTHVYLRSRIEGRAQDLATEDRSALRREATLPVEAVVGSVQKMRRLVERLESRVGTVWAQYEKECSYGADERAQKERFVEEAARRKPGSIAWDVGANTGVFSEILAGFFDTVVAIDSDVGAVDGMYRRLGDTRSIVPLVMDITDPSPDRGWHGRERRALTARAAPDFSVWLAVAHHICLGGEVPVGAFADLVADTSPAAVVEFVAPDDPMSQRLLATRTTDRPDYTRDRFLAALERRFSIDRSQAVSPTRELFSLRRR